MIASEADDSPSLSRPGELEFAADQLPWQRSLRWAALPRDRRALWLGLVLAVLVTLLEVVGFGSGVRPHSSLHANVPDPVIQVVLIEPEPIVPPPPPEPEPPEFIKRPSRIVIDAPKVRTTPPPPRTRETSDAMSARIGTAGPPPAAPAPPTQLFNPDGSIRLGAAASLVAPPPPPKNPQEAAKARWAEIANRGNPLDCKKTRFAQAFAPDEDGGDKVARKYLRWIGLYDGEAAAHRAQQRAQAGGCDPAK